MSEQESQKRNQAQRDVIAEKRRSRRGFGNFQQKMGDIPKIPGYHLHIFNDEGNRLADALKAGYEFVTPKEIGRTSETGADISEARVSFLVGTGERGEPLRGYLMKLESELWDEDFEAAQSQWGQVMDSIQRGGNNELKEGDRYIPKDGISIKSRKR